jgi:hypothetical protein
MVPAKPSFFGRRIFLLPLEHFHKNCNHADEEKRAAVLLGFGFVFAQSQAATGMFLRSSLAKRTRASPKFLAAAGLQFFFKRSGVFVFQLIFHVARICSRKF